MATRLTGVGGLQYPSILFYQGCTMGGVATLKRTLIAVIDTE
ncbi:MAG: hypothetical protein WA549_03105 [Thermoplasmata archaeon]